MNSPNVVGQRPPKKITNQVQQEKHPDGSIRSEVGFISSPLVADAAIPGAKTWGWPG